MGTVRNLFVAHLLQSYSRLRAVQARTLHRPTRFDDLAELLRRAGVEGRRVTFRAAGRSFDDQALGDDLVVDVTEFDRIVGLDVERREITVECGATWDAIVAATLPHGLVPHVLVTTSRATAGGTVAANCVSRASSRHGAIGDHVRALSLLTPAGELLRCSRTDNADVFRAVVGGLGHFGLVTEITFDLMPIGARRNVRSVIDRVEGLAPFTAHLTEASLGPGDDDGVYSVFSLAEPQRGAVFRSSYTDEPVDNTLHIYRAYAWYRPVLELLFLSSRVSNAFCHASYEHAFGRGPFVDDFRGYTFCMEANEHAKLAAERVGLSLRSSQQTYQVPTPRLFDFLATAAELFARFRVYPSLLDCLYRPADDFLLSSANGLAGFCVSFLFEGLGADKLARMTSCMLELNEHVIRFGGRAHLVKNVYATLEQLRAMYGHVSGEMARIKARTDPGGVLWNGFFDRTFGQPIAAEPAPPRPVVDAVFGPTSSIAGE